MKFVGRTMVQPGEIGKRCWSWAAKSWSDNEMEREQKSAIWLVDPGTDTGWTSIFLWRQSWARWRKRKAFGAMEDVEPLEHQATAGVLSEAHSKRW